MHYFFKVSWVAGVTMNLRRDDAIELGLSIDKAVASATDVIELFSRMLPNRASSERVVNLPAEPIGGVIEERRCCGLVAKIWSWISDRYLGGLALR